jgi:hypothetical protein
MLVVQGYLFLTVAIGFILTTKSDAFRKLSFWKQFIVLSISPLMLLRKIFRDFKKESL